MTNTWNVRKLTEIWQDNETIKTETLEKNCMRMRYLLGEGNGYVLY